MSLISSLIFIFVLLLVCFSVCAFVMNVLYPMAINFYFKRANFLAIKARVTRHIEECNELNDHIEHLKLSYVDIESFDYGTAPLVDTSLYNMNRPKWISDNRDRRTHQSSRSQTTTSRA